MTASRYAWKVVDRVRAVDRALTRRDDSRSVLIDCTTPMNYAMAAPIQAALAQDARVRFYVTSSGRDGNRAALHGHIQPGTTVVAPWAAAMKRIDVYLTADLLWAPLPRGAKRIQMFHGVAGKFQHDYDAPETSMRRWHRIFFVNQRRLRNFISAGAIDPDSDAPRLVGMPKVDCLVDGSLSRDAVLQRLELDPARPTILYAPTWSAASSLNTMGLELVQGLVGRSWNVIVKLHDRSRDPRAFYSGGVDWAACLTRVLPPGQGVLVTDSNICPYLAAADVMITDHSSAGFEYLLLDRPLVRINVPALLRGSNIGEEYVRLLADASHSVEDPRGAVKAVEFSLANPSDRSATRRAVASELFYKAGGATARAVDELYEAMELAPAVATTSMYSRTAVV